MARFVVGFWLGLWWVVVSLWLGLWQVCGWVMAGFVVGFWLVCSLVFAKFVVGLGSWCLPCGGVVERERVDGGVDRVVKRVTEIRDE